MMDRQISAFSKRFDVPCKSKATDTRVSVNLQTTFVSIPQARIHENSDVHRMLEFTFIFYSRQLLEKHNFNGLENVEGWIKCWQWFRVLWQVICSLFKRRSAVSLKWSAISENKSGPQILSPCCV